MALQGSDNFVIERGGTVYRTLGSDILAYVQANLGTTEYDVANIAARNALTGLSTGDRVFVLDATGTLPCQAAGQSMFGAVQLSPRSQSKRA